MPRIRGERRVVRIPVHLPNTLSAGPVRLLVSDGPLLDQMLNPLAHPATPPLDLNTVIEQLNRLHVNDRVYVTLLAPQPQATMKGVQLPSVPLSMANVLQSTQDGSGGLGFSLNGETAIPLGSASVDEALHGSQILTVELQP